MEAVAPNIVRVASILLQHPSFTNQTIFSLASASKWARELIKTKTRVVDITLSLPCNRKNTWPLRLHSCITDARHLHTLKLEISYQCGFGFWSDYVHVTVNDLTSLACCPNLRHLKFVQNNDSGSYTDPDEYFGDMTEELAGIDQLNLAETWPVLESIHFQVESDDKDFIALNVKTLPSTCHTLICNLHEEQFADIPASVTALDTLQNHMSTGCFIKLYTSDAVIESSLLSFAIPRSFAHARDILPLLPTSLNEIIFSQSNFTETIMQLYNVDEFPTMCHLIHLQRLDIGYMSLSQDFEESRLQQLSKVLPPTLKVLVCSLRIQSVPMHWDRPNDERLKLFAKYFAARLEIQNYDDAGCPK